MTDHEHIYEYRKPTGTSAYIMSTPTRICTVCGQPKPEMSARERWEAEHGSDD